MLGNTFELLIAWDQSRSTVRQKKWWRVILSCIWWTIWKERNSKCFEDKSKSIQKVKMNCNLNLHFLCKEFCIVEADSILDFLEAL